MKKFGVFFLTIVMLALCFCLTGCKNNLSKDDYELEISTGTITKYERDGYHKWVVDE